MLLETCTVAPRAATLGLPLLVISRRPARRGAVSRERVGKRRSFQRKSVAAGGGLHPALGAEVEPRRPVKRSETQRSRNEMLLQP